MPVISSASEFVLRSEWLTASHILNFCMGTDHREIIMEWKMVQIWQPLTLLLSVFVCPHFDFVRCVSCLSTRWKCYWDQANHLCLSNKEDSKPNLIEVSIYDLWSRHMPSGGCGISVLIVRHNPDSAGTKVFFNNLTPDWWGKSNRGVIHCGVTVSQLQCAEMLKPAIKSQEGLFLQTHNRLMWRFKAPQSGS